MWCSFFRPRRRPKYKCKWFSSLCLSLSLSLLFVWFGAVLRLQVQQVAASATGVLPKQVFVHPVEGDDTATCGSYSEPCRTLGQAYVQVGPGDTILLAPGLYKDQRDRNVGSPLHTTTISSSERVFSKSEVVIVGLDSGDKPVIDLEHSGLLFDFRHVSKITLRGLVVMHGSGKAFSNSEEEQEQEKNQTTTTTTSTTTTSRTQGGCMRFEYAQDILLEEVDFIRCQSGGDDLSDGEQGEGGSVYIKNSMVIFTHCQFHESRAYTGGVVFATGNETYETTMPYFMNCLFSNSSAYLGGVASVHMEGGEGAGQMRGQVTWENCTFVESHATFGGAVDSGGVSVCSFQGCTFENVSALTSGGLVRASGSSQMILRSSWVRNSRAAASGGSIHCTDNSVVNILHMAFQNSTCEGSGGVLHSQGRSKVVLSQVVMSDAEAGQEGGAVRASGQSRVTLDVGHVVNARAEQGGGMFAADASSLHIRGGLFSNCSATRGGSLYAESQHKVEVQQSVFHESLAGFGSAIYTTAAAPVGVHNCSFVNTSGLLGEEHSSSSSIIYAEESGERNLVESGTTLCGFIGTVLNISSPIFSQDSYGGYGIFWDTNRKVYGICAYEDLVQRMGIDSSLLVEAKFGRFLATGPQAIEIDFPSKGAEEEVRPGTPFEIRIRVLDGFGQGLSGNQEALRLRVQGGPGIASFGNGSAAYEDVSTYDGNVLISDIVTRAPPGTNLGLEVQSDLAELGNVRVNLTVGPCLPGQEYSTSLGSCLPAPPSPSMCSDYNNKNATGSFFTSQVESCSAQGTERRITYSWIHSEWERYNASRCSAELNPPAEKKFDCWFVSVHSGAARAVLVLSGGALAAHMVVCLFLVSYRKHRTVSLGQPLFSTLIILGNVSSLLCPFLSVGKPSHASCMVGPFLISLGFSVTLGSLLVKAQRLSDILSNKKLEKAKVLTRFTYSVLLIFVIDLALHLSLFLVWPPDTTRPTYRREHQATIEESSCVSPSGKFILAILVCKVLQAASGARSGVQALKVARLSHEARLAGQVLLESLAAVTVALTITQLPSWWLSPHLRYAVTCSCILFCTMLSLTCVVLPSLLLGILQSKRAAKALRRGNNNNETFSVDFPSSWESLFFYTATSKEHSKEFEVVRLDTDVGDCDFQWKAKKQQQQDRDQDQDPGPPAIASSAQAHVIHVIANQTR